MRENKNDKQRVANVMYSVCLTLLGKLEKFTGKW